MLNRSKIVALSMGGALAVPLTGCYTLKADVRPAAETVALAGTSGKFVRHFSRDERAWFIGGGLVQFAGPKPGDLLLGQSGGGKIANAKITTEQTFVDGLIWFGCALVVNLGLGLATTATGLNTNPVVPFVTPVISALLVPGVRTITVEGDALE